MTFHGHRWIKKGRIFVPSGRHPKIRSHAANPLPVKLSGDVFRIFYSGRDSENRSSVGAFDYDLLNGRIVKDYEEPFFCAGPAGSFFEDGVSIGNCYAVGEKTYMLFMGWQNPEGAHWRGDIGRLVVNSDLTLTLDLQDAFISGNEFNSISLSYPWVQVCETGGYEMYYGTTEAWDAGNGEMLHIIRHAVSSDGHKWRRTGRAIPYEIGVAQAFSRPTILKCKDGTQDMWFSCRGGDGAAYRIGHSRFSGDVWSKPPGHSGIDVSAEGWDSEMIEYPFVFEHRGVCYMLYNGNGYGRTGIGLAELKK